MESPPDDRSPLAKAMAWVSTITAISLEMALPALLGVGLDRWLATKFVFTMLGAVGGLALGVYSLLRLSKGPRR